MNFKPYSYQDFAINWILNHPQCAVLLEMG